MSQVVVQVLWPRLGCRGNLLERLLPVEVCGYVIGVPSYDMPCEPWLIFQGRLPLASFYLRLVCCLLGGNGRLCC